ncbi:hypothetical protein DPEC_G00064170 [Dallia pectoralis]|uniref:Uncharacterized protein n=1 Tax=Dallia pectoralis TaxID=75939 RepID=A0ACC2H7X1_DALPE|nr:hypothetical protein DPEC_G00064170 [Dallia pectoralis]
MGADGCYWKSKWSGDEGNMGSPCATHCGGTSPEPGQFCDPDSWSPWHLLCAPANWVYIWYVVRRKRLPLGLRNEDGDRVLSQNPVAISRRSAGSTGEFGESPGELGECRSATGLRTDGTS